MKTEGRFCLPPYETILWDPPASFIIVDDLFYLRSMRRPFERMARAFGLRYVVVYVDTPLEVALQRNAGRPENVSFFFDFPLLLLLCAVGNILAVIRWKCVQKGCLGSTMFLLWRVIYSVRFSFRRVRFLMVWAW